MANFSPLAAEITLEVSGTPANFNGFRVLAALLYGTLLQLLQLQRCRFTCAQKLTYS